MADHVIDKNISSVLGIDSMDNSLMVTDGDISVHSYPTKPNNKNLPELANNNEKELQLQQDFDYTRQSIHSAIDQGNDALVNLVHFANNSGGPSAYKEVSGLIKALSIASDTLMGMHKDTVVKRASSDGSNDKPNATQQNAQTITNNYTMTTAEYLEKVEKGEIDEDEDDIWSDDLDNE